ncbi:peroxisome proliferator-activated receptor gamma coactivator-related protein 1 isoform X2 [Polyodon spathula]|uniref:peroxisome proliferator-activated receptor gamma coactivator-related protein 1 isoform X2 n=1 Tax=Polyodon spathula TaxID=7913 RepID=UPI001B7EB9AC|nr:peroxisome proliferator-activated receptor gamma coactivator-related protein 1 isoform X2 [Polyodon spathula]
MAARWGAGEEILSTGTMELFTTYSLNESEVLGGSLSSSGLHSLSLNNLDEGETLESFHGCFDPSIISILEDSSTVSETKSRLDEEGEATLLTALTEILDNVDDENLSPFDTLPDSELFTSNKERDRSPLRRLLSLARSPPEREALNLEDLGRPKPLSASSAVKVENGAPDRQGEYFLEGFGKLRADGPRGKARTAPRGAATRGHLAVETMNTALQRSDGEEEDGEASSPAQGSSESEGDPSLPSGAQLGIPWTFEASSDCLVSPQSFTIGDLVKYTHPCYLTVCLESGDGDTEQIIANGGLVLEILEGEEQGGLMAGFPELGILLADSGDGLAESMEQSAHPEEECRSSEAPGIEAQPKQDTQPDVGAGIEVEGKVAEERAKGQSPERRASGRRKKRKSRAGPGGGVREDKPKSRSREEVGEEEEVIDVCQPPPTQSVTSGAAALKESHFLARQLESSRLQSTQESCAQTRCRAKTREMALKANTEPVAEKPKSTKKSCSVSQRLTGVKTHRQRGLPAELQPSPGLVAAPSSTVTNAVVQEPEGPGPATAPQGESSPLESEAPLTGCSSIQEQKDPKPRMLSLEQYRLLRQKKKPTPVEKIQDQRMKWPTLPDLPRELPPIPCLPEPVPTAQREADRPPTKTGSAWPPMGPGAPPTPEALLVSPGMTVALSRPATHLTKHAVPGCRPSPVDPRSYRPRVGTALPVAPAAALKAPCVPSVAAASDALHNPTTANGPSLLFHATQNSTSPPIEQDVHRDGRTPLQPNAASVASFNKPRMTSDSQSIASPQQPPKAVTLQNSIRVHCEPATQTAAGVHQPRPRPNLPKAPVQQPESGVPAARAPGNTVGHKQLGSRVPTPCPPAQGSRVPTPCPPAQGSRVPTPCPPAQRKAASVDSASLRSAIAQPLNALVKSPTEDLIQAFTSEIGIQACDLTSLLEQFEETQAKEQHCVPEVSGRAAAVGNSGSEPQVDRKVLDRVRGPDLASTAGLTPPATPPHHMWKPLAPVSLLRKPKLPEGPKLSPAKAIQIIEPKPLPHGKTRTKLPSSLAPSLPSENPSFADHDYCLPGTEPACVEKGRRWNVKQQSSITIKPIEQRAPAGCPRKCAVQPLDHRTLSGSVLLSPDSSPCRLEADAAPRDSTEFSSSRRFRYYSPEKRERGRARRRSHTRSSSSSESDSSGSRSSSPLAKRRRRYRSRRSRSSSSSPSHSRQWRRAHSYCSSHSGSWSRSSSSACSRSGSWSRSPSPCSSSSSSSSRSSRRRRRDSRRRPGYDCHRYNSRDRVHWQELRNQRKEKAIEERRVVYVGKIRSGMTRKELRERFSVYGEIEECALHFRQEGDNYGFVTYRHTEDAFAAIENGKKLRQPDELPFDLCFGGRRQFCKMSYADLDSNRDSESTPARSKFDGLDFDTLLKQAQNSLRR